MGSRNRPRLAGIRSAASCGASAVAHDLSHGPGRPCAKLHLLRLLTSSTANDLKPISVIDCLVAQPCTSARNLGGVAVSIQVWGPRLAADARPPRRRARPRYPVCRAFVEGGLRAKSCPVPRQLRPSTLRTNGALRLSCWPRTVAGEAPPPVGKIWRKAAGTFPVTRSRLSLAHSSCRTRSPAPASCWSRHAPPPSIADMCVTGSPASSRSSSPSTPTPHVVVLEPLEPLAQLLKFASQQLDIAAAVATPLRH